MPAWRIANPSGALIRARVRTCRRPPRPRPRRAYPVAAPLDRSTMPWCYSKSMNAKTETKQCEVCRQPFLTRRSRTHTRACSSKCRGKILRSKPKTDISIRFWARVKKNEPGKCWPWDAPRSQDGNYGTMYVDGKHRMAHRIAWALTKGPIPSGLDVLHHCDNPPCCNPDHLFVGTRSDNMQDMVRKGRHKSPLTDKYRSRTSS